MSEYNWRSEKAFGLRLMGGAARAEIENAYIRGESAGCRARLAGRVVKNPYPAGRRAKAWADGYDMGFRCP